ncbi:ABC transporter ATP-binding protein [Lacimicrobium alkaliphilum]|uniref:Iron ABC transporter ATP-binding protein n=1 Tax=Lacimicrobium alkaliphilum TaxID=1526571 RepID=A0ABQ1RI97_9ALTE|nr:ABC transporter ATP-binding protein [Lacimicrobium alkaliphilum]GGD67936.1 iron ABC transporter ATP-binding protein [Lacimicrobium alkaliphilum]
MLKLQKIVIAYQQQQVVNAFDLELDSGEIGCLLGASGCGKTSVLRAIAGFEPVRAGEILLHQRIVSKVNQSLAPEKRKVGMVFQDFALFPHLTVEQNVAFGLGTWPSAQRKQRVAELLGLVELSDYAHRYSHALSGGQQQRVALARAMAPKPDVLLLDEPFSSLDSELRESLASQVRNILKHENITALMVTHDRTEAFAMADKIGVMSDGRMLQWGTPAQLYHLPDNKLVADFIGKCTFLSATVTGDRTVESALGVLDCGYSLQAPCNTSVELMIRPHQLCFTEQSDVKAKICDKVFRGADFLYQLELENGEQLFCAAAIEEDFPQGQWVGIELNLNQAVLFPAESEGMLA